MLVTRVVRLQKIRHLGLQSASCLMYSGIIAVVTTNPNANVIE